MSWLDYDDSADRLLGRKLPSDGSALCEELLRQVNPVAVPDDPPAASP